MRLTHLQSAVNGILLHIVGHISGSDHQLAFNPSHAVVFVPCSPQMLGFLDAAVEINANQRQRTSKPSRPKPWGNAC
jgi:hypothetical protein